MLEQIKVAMTKELSKVFMKNWKLCNKFLKGKGEISKKAHSTQRKNCFNLKRKTKRKFFANIKINNLKKLKERFCKMANWKTPGPDGVHGYSIKMLASL